MRAFLLLLMSFVLMGCPERERIFSDYEPEVLERSVFEKSIELISLSAEKPTVKNAGKIYLQGDFIFIGDSNKGFYVYDNKTPEKPTLKAFLKIPGATDLAIRNGVLYVNQAVDLVALTYDITTLKVSVHKRIKNTFPPMKSPDGYSAYESNENNVVVDWHKRVK